MTFICWLQVDYPYLGRLCALVIPSALTALDHWSPQVKVRPNSAIFLGLIHFSHPIASSQQNAGLYFCSFCLAV